MSKIHPLNNTWKAEAALQDALEYVKEYPDAECIILLRRTPTQVLNFITAGVTNAQSMFAAEEFKYCIINRCHDCKCKQEGQ